MFLLNIQSKLYNYSAIHRDSVNHRPKLYTSHQFNIHITLAVNLAMHNVAVVNNVRGNVMVIVLVIQLNTRPK